MTIRESETFVITLRISTYTIWQFIVCFLVFLQCYPDDDSKSSRNMLVIDNI
jgi:hypothetical protein